MTIPKFFEKHSIGSDEKNRHTIFFTGFALSNQLYQSIEDKVISIVKKASFINIVEILPECFKTDDQI